MKKIAIAVVTLAVVLPMGWAGATWFFGNQAESVMDQRLEEANETVSARWDLVSIEKSSFENGFVSSTATTAIYPAGREEMPDEDKLFLKHTIYHGPLAMTPDGPKICQAYTISVVDWSGLEKDKLEELREVFGDEEPLTIRSIQKMDGAEEVLVELAAASFSDDDGSEARFGGFLAGIGFDAERTKFWGDFDAAVSDAKFPNDQGSMKMHPSSADFSYTKGEEFAANFQIGAVDMIVEEGTVKMTESIGSIDIREDSHFKVDVKLGDLEVISPPEQDMTMNASGLVFTADFRRIDETSLITVGKGELRAPKIEIEAEGSRMELSDFRVGIESGLEQDKLFGRVGYRFGGIQMAGPAFPGAGEFGDLLEGGASLEFGVRGVDRRVIENFYQVIKVIEEEPNADAATLQRLAPELAETFSNDLFQLFQPGLEIYYELLVGEKGEGAQANLSLKMKGEKRLDELKTGREIVNSIEGALRAEVANSFLPDEMVQAMMREYVQQGLVQAREDKSGYEFKGDLTNGVLHLAGEATPLLESFGPMLDEPIPWDEFKAGIRAGILESAEGALEKAGRGADSDAGDDESVK